MLGIGGYDGGYMTYYSRLSNNDLEGIRKVTKDETMTWKKYKKSRYELMESKWNNVKHINPNELVEEYVNALKIDARNEDRNVTAATNVRRINYHHLKRVTNDFETEALTNNVQVVHIKNAQEFKEKITANLLGSYILDNDIDLSTLTGEKAIIPGYFMGRLDGNGHKIYGNTLPVFEHIRFSYITNIKLENSQITSEEQYTGALAKLVSYSTIKNIIANGIEVSSTANEIGGLFGNVTGVIMENIHVTNTSVQSGARGGILAGYVTNSIIEKSSTNGNVTGTGNAIGGFVGEAVNSTIFNSYSVGKVKGRQDNGGFIGYSNSSKVRYCFSSASIESTSGGSGGFIGQATNNSKIENNIAFGSTKNAYKFDGRTSTNVLENYQNNYEYEETVGTSTLLRANIDFEGKIAVAKMSEVTSEEFYKNTLHWDNTIWDFSNVLGEGLPKLKNSDTNNITSIFEKIQISSVEEFLKISEAPDKIYTITRDLNFENLTNLETESLITVNFTGKIDGNGHTLSNLNGASLFANFRGIAQNINIREFVNEKNGNFIAAFAQQTYEATVKNVKFENITLKGQNNVAVVSGMDGRERANSIFENISIKNANVTGTGVYVSAFVGRKYGGSVKNIYVQGEVTTGGTESAGLIGATHEGIIIENVFVDVDLTRTNSSDKRYINGGLIGNSLNTPSIKNCITIGNSIGFEGQEINKTTGLSEENIVSLFTNCYELATSQGLTNVTTQTTDTNSLKAATQENLRDKNFYKTTLGFDEGIWNLDRVTTNGYPELK